MQRVWVWGAAQSDCFLVQLHTSAGMQLKSDDKIFQRKTAAKEEGLRKKDKPHPHPHAKGIHSQSGGGALGLEPLTKRLGLSAAIIHMLERLERFQYLPPCKWA